MEEVKTRRVSKKDLEAVQDFIKDELNRRKKNTFRKKHEERWKVIDQQIAMEPMVRKKPDGTALDADWHNAVEPGELAKSSEVICADVRRLAFPNSRNWFDVHAETPPQMGPNGQKIQLPQEKQDQLDGAIRALMVQQQLDFAFKERFDLAVHEALHHGSFVVTVDWEYITKVFHDNGVSFEHIGAPAWKTHSMWNCYPDSSASAAASTTFYRGSMMIVSYRSEKDMQELLDVKGYIKSQWKNVEKDTHKLSDGSTTEDYEVITYYGDCYIPRKDGEALELPNSKVELVNGVLMYYNTNEIPVLNLIYSGYEKTDPRDPYFTSPIIKESSNQTVLAVLQNKFLDLAALHAEPPIVCDKTDQAMIESGGAKIAPGTVLYSNNVNNFKQVEIGDASAILSAIQMVTQEIQQGTGVNAARAGAMDSIERTATEVRKIAEGGNIRAIDFVDKLEHSALKAFLYIQHEFNKRRLSNYPVYNPESDSPDFIRLSKTDLPPSVHFDIVGSRGLLDEDSRNQRTQAVLQAAFSNPITASLIDPEYAIKSSLQDAGQKAPERFLKSSQDQNQIPPQVQQQIQQMQQQAQQQMQQMQQTIQQLQDQLGQEKQQQQAKMMEVQSKNQIAQMEERRKKEQADREFALKHQVEERHINLEEHKVTRQLDIESQKVARELAIKEATALQTIIKPQTPNTPQTPQTPVTSKPEKAIQDKTVSLESKIEALSKMMITSETNRKARSDLILGHIKKKGLFPDLVNSLTPKPPTPPKQ